MSFEDVWQKFLTWLLDMLPNVIGAALIFAGGWWLSNVVVRLIKRTMTRARTETGIVTFLCSLANAAAKIIISIMALSQLGVPAWANDGDWCGGGGTVGLALKENMTNIASGAQIVFTKPFAVGDYLLVDNVEGTVERIEMMFTTLRTFDNKEIVIPNSHYYRQYDYKLYGDENTAVGFALFGGIRRRSFKSKRGASRTDG